MTRVSDDQSLIPPDGVPVIERPIVIAHKTEEGEGYVIDLAALDPAMNDPRCFGIMTSDLLDHIAAAYQYVSGRDQREIRKHIAKVMRDKDKLKARDPSRGASRGATRWPTRQ